jgi:hypothetical protein
VDRRGFLANTSLGASGLAAAGTPALVSAAERGGSLLYSMDDYMARWDSGLERIGQWSFADLFPEARSLRSRDEDLARKSMQALFTTAMFTDLPIESQVHAGVQNRMWRAQSTMDEAVGGMKDFLEDQTPGDLARVRSLLGDDPEVVRRISGFFDLEAGRAGLSDARRRATRDLFTQVGWRLEKQPPSILIEEYLAKVEKITASDVDAEARQRWLVSKVGEKAFWIQEQERSTRDRRISRGQRVMGIGGLVTLGGWLLIAVGSAFDEDANPLTVLGVIAGVTVGPIMLVVGLLMLMAGGLTARSES